MRTAEERRAEVYLLGAKRIRERRKRIRAALYCSFSVAFICCAIFMTPYIASDNVSDARKSSDAAGAGIGYAGGYIESIEFKGDGISEVYTDRAEVTLISLCIKDITKGEYTAASQVTPLYTITLCYSNGNDAVYELTEDTLSYNGRCYRVSEEQYSKLMSYLK